MVKKNISKSKNELLEKRITLKKESSWLKFNEKEKKEIYSFAEDYKQFLKVSKTERLCIQNIIVELKKNGFKDINNIKSIKKGDKIFKNVRDKSVLAFVVGKNNNKFSLVGSHVDSPRLDLKPHPIYEDSGLGLIKTHYYGGVKKYHWVNTPLEMHGIIFTKNGKKVIINIGNKENEPKFMIPDLLPHLAKNQMERKASKIVEGEELNILLGNMPINDEKIKEKVKFNILKKLYEKYGIIEEDFAFAELELVPATNPMDIGFDGSLIGAYGQDDKVCTYAGLRSILEIKNPKNTAVMMFVDKEEIGSMGDTGAASFILQNFADDYQKLIKLKISVSKLLENSDAISADVTAGMNPNYKDVHDPLNVSILSYGVSVEKYGGGGGKYSTQDAHAEYMQFIRNILEKNKIPWQTGELGKIDCGGGGTIGMYISRYGLNCLDAGPCVLGMHSPCEVVSKADIYSSYLLYKEFLMN